MRVEFDNRIRTLRMADLRLVISTFQEVLPLRAFTIFAATNLSSNKDLSLFVECSVIVYIVDYRKFVAQPIS